MSIQTKALIALAIVWFAAMAGMHVFWFEPMTGGLRAPDSRPWGYAADDFAAWQAALGADGQAAFLRWHSRFADFVFPWLMMAAVVFAMRETLRRLPRYRHLPRWTQIAVPLALVAPYGLFDVLENGLVADMLTGAVPVNDASVGLASAYTLLKWAFVALALGALFVFRLAASRHARRT
ncbi:hypothetical protein [Oceaniradius stylonematis]|uniref:hypothetical protein n=1 Tax=Oceaniradius stylonematis TaxID=2184161 RepID=UPI000F418C52|nr:hypothetical protein [Oceaniradius stylonematis]RNC91302.1 MAG: hypothetical protein ED558_15320 [Oricola sp.]